LVEVLARAREVARFPPRLRAAEERLRVLRVEEDGLLVVLERLLALAELVPVARAHAVSERELGVEGDRPVEVGESGLAVARAPASDGAIDAAPRVVRRPRHGAVEVLERRLRVV